MASLLPLPGASYLPLTGEIELDLLGPLFCFPLTGLPASAPLTLSARNANGDPIIDQLPLDSNLRYLPGGDRLLLEVPEEAACFHAGPGGFGLSGLAPPGGDDPNLIFRDRFEPQSTLKVEFFNVPDFVRVNELINYQVEVRNEGQTTASAVGFQELYPRNPSYYPDGQLTAGIYQCQGIGGASCADATPGTSEPSIRGRDLVLPPGGIVRFNVIRSIFSASSPGGVIDLYAGAIDRSLPEASNWDAATARMVLIGEGQTIAATLENASPPVADGVDPAFIRVTALDAAKFPTPGVFIQLSNADGLDITPLSGTTGADGSVLFTARSAGPTGTFQPEFFAPDLGASGVGTTAEVSFVAGPPAQLSAFTIIDNIPADGTSTGLVEVVVRDAFGNPTPNETVTVGVDEGLSFFSNSAVTDVSGRAYFTVSSTNAGTFNPSFIQSEALVSASTAITFRAGSPDRLVFASQPSDVIAGAVMSPPVAIFVLDAFDNLVDWDNSTTVTLQLRQNGTGVSFFPDLTASNGILLFDSIVVNQAGTGYDLRAFSDLPTITSSSFEVLPAP
ncbi:Ig-like domain-containing protein [Wenzhouxiangella marina]|uniref:Uncharacterized protein n=1 Tax=Wenzhouxiangella marina TaxID=1579979 RepID=A0A0K0XTM2_9GAMM|nr:Ig-like domain-containing protein [Wenzhouxiangella marina]AKS41010.1 hypothetical protein WM2015_629 [Wenzhouxiangella marina]MBB6087888.1 putative repeat protein (TIGR01451 family) [Wenzhouxiangella marina]